MAIAHEFEYFKPESFSGALDLLSQYGEKAVILAGGTDLINWIREDFIHPEVVIDIKALHELNKIEFKKKTLFIGSLVTFNELVDSKTIKQKFPLLMEASHVVGCHGVRNRATMVGNICSGVPCCDSGPVLSVYDAHVVVESSEGERKIAVADWFVAPKRTALKVGEIVRGIEIALPDEKNAACYVKLGRYRGEDLAQVSVAILAFTFNKEYRVAYGAVGPTPIRAHKLEKFLKGKVITDKLLDKISKMVDDEISPITDVRATKEYRIHMAKVMTRRGLKAAASRLRGKGPAYGQKVI